MTTLWFLATEKGGFGFHFDLLEANLINLSIVIGVLVYFGSKFLGSTLEGRRNTIEEAIRDAERRQSEAKAALAEQQQKLALAKTEAEGILKQAQENAQKAHQAILEQAQVDIERMKASAAQDLSSQQDRVVRDLRQRVVDMALADVQERLPERLTGDIQHRLIDKSIAMLGG
ncbi:MAG: F0F1 ATP synthase subunit B [Cyanobacteria bacterium]|jgi:F-type H+-transporting ATPase subunit b|nr:F0F1 ATP synthase subunit B [Cyanobacteriota bacterium]MDA0867363.1 F0F1 ATP synthase subunit B [Cyanobacteriota bacterium]